MQAVQRGYLQPLLSSLYNAPGSIQIVDPVYITDTMETVAEYDYQPPVLVSQSVVDSVASPSLRGLQSDTTVPVGVSPLNFPPCPWGPGRPRVGRQGAPGRKVVGKRKASAPPAFNFKPEMLSDYLVPEPPKKRRGQPPGAKNKLKLASFITAPETDTRTRADISVDPDSDIVFYDSADKCNICKFPLNQPTKVDKAKTKCGRCDRIVHKPCLEKYDEQCISLK